MILFHSNYSDSDQWVMYMHVILHFSQCHNGWLQTTCLFTCGSTMVSWRYM